MISALDLIKNKKNIKEILINIGKSILVVIIGLILYYGVTQLVLEKYDLELTNYQNYGSTLNIADILKNFGNSVINCYKDFFMFFLGNDIISNTNYRREVFYGMFLIISIIMIILSIVFIKEDNKKQKFKRGILAALFILVIPIGLNIIDLIIIENQMYSLTAGQMILIIPFVFSIFECIDKGIIFKWFAILSCIYVMGTYYIADNTSYAALKLTYNQAYSTTVRILDRIENTEGYRKEFPILFGGIVGNNNYPRTSNLYTYTVGSVVTNPTFHGTYSGSVGTWTKFIKIFFGIDIPNCTPETYYSIVNSEEYKNMEIFPSQNSIKIMDGIVVVKLSEEPDMPY